MSNNIDIGPKKSMFVLVIVIGCFSILWPKVFYPMLIGNTNQQVKPGSNDRSSGKIILYKSLVDTVLSKIPCL